MQNANNVSQFSEADFGNVIPPWVTFAQNKKSETRMTANVLKTDLNT